MIRRRILAPAVIIGAVAAGGVAGAILGVPGLSGAQEASTTATAPPAPPGMPPFGEHRGGGELDAAAKALNLTTQQLLDKLADGKTTIADVAKQQHVDINAVIDAMVGADRDRITNMVNNPLPRPGEHGPGPGHFGMGGGARAGNLDAAAKAIGISSDALRTELRAGKTIADVAKAHNVDVNTVIDALVADATAHIDAAQKDGHLPKAEADHMKSTLKDMITHLVHGDLPKPPAGFGFRGGRGFRGGMPGDGGAMPPALQPQI
jgi:hypothetical protein